MSEESHSVIPSQQSTLEETTALPSDNGSSQQNEAKRQRTLEWIAKIQVVFSAFLVLFAFGQVIVGQWQWDATDKQWKSMERQLDLMKNEQRPWIVLQSPKMNPIEVGKVIECNLSFENGGKSPAFVFSEGAIVACVDKPRDDTELDLVEQLPNSQKPPPAMPGIWKTPVMAGEVSSNWGAKSGVVIDEQLIGDIERGAKKVFVLAMVRYLDTDNLAHRTLGCWAYDTQLKELVQYGRYNHMD